MIWTKRYYGVSHLSPLPPGYQITLSDYGIFVQIYCLDMYSETPFTVPLHDEKVGTVEQARTLGEKWAKTLPPRNKRPHK